MRARTLNAPLLPLLVILAQVLAVGRDWRANFVPSIQHEFEEGMQTLGPSSGARVRALMRAHEGQSALGGMVRALAATRFAQDLGTDTAEGRIIAHRAISQEPLPSPEEVCFFLDWLGDHSVHLPRSNIESEQEVASEDGPGLLAWASDRDRH